MDKTPEEFRKSAPEKRGYEPVCKICRAKDYASDPKKKIAAKKRWLAHKYKISLEEYNKLYEDQKGKCAICGVNDTISLHVDHCHTTNKIRSLLCKNCNTGIGQFKENLTLLESAVQYLKKWST